MYRVSTMILYRFVSSALSIPELLMGRLVGVLICKIQVGVRSLNLRYRATPMCAVSSMADINNAVWL